MHGHNLNRSGFRTLSYEARICSWDLCLHVSMIFLYVFILYERFGLLTCVVQVLCPFCAFCCVICMWSEAGAVFLVCVRV